MLPFQLVWDRCTSRNEWTVFQNLVLRIVKFGFGNLSCRVGQVLFSEQQAFPFVQFRTHGLAAKWREKVSPMLKD